MGAWRRWKFVAESFWGGWELGEDEPLGTGDWELVAVDSYHNLYSI